MEKLRAAVIERGRNGHPTVSQVQRYMPSNYSAVGEPDGSIRICGRDSAGWTLAGYVLPRLASGMIYATEVQPTAAEDAADAYRRWNP